MLRIDGSVALVTGSASGLGRAAATRLLAAGAKLVLDDTDRDGGKELAEAGVGTFVPAEAADRRGRDGSGGQPDDLRAGRVRPVGHGDRPAAGGRRPADRHVAAETDQHAARVPVGGHDRPHGAVGAQPVGGGPQVEPDAGRQPEQRPVEPDPLPSLSRDRRGGGVAAPVVDGREVTVVARATSASHTVGSVRPLVHRAAVSATPTASARPSLSMNSPPPQRCTQLISESSRNRLACRSTRSSTPSTAAHAAPRLPGGHTATRALLPSASRSVTATVSSPVCTCCHSDATVSSLTDVIAVSCRCRRGRAGRA